MIFALGMTACCWSITLPLRLPRNSCAHPVVSKHIARAMEKNMRRGIDSTPHYWQFTRVIEASYLWAWYIATHCVSREPVFAALRRFAKLRLERAVSATTPGLALSLLL